MQIFPNCTLMKSDVEAAFNDKRKINLIKLYRDKFNTSLKEAKDAIEKYLPCGASSDDSMWTSEKKIQILNLFFPPPINEDPENRLYFAITEMKEHWQVLGYKSFKDGILSVLANF